MTGPASPPPDAPGATIDLEGIAVLVESLRPGATVRFYPSIGSTNDEARDLGRSGASDGSVVIAARQSRGRGRRNRPWISHPGGMYTSVLFRPSGAGAGYAAALQLAGGIAVAEAAAPWLPEAAELLWPNDVLCRGQKISGVLVESELTGSTFDHLVCGIGLNLGQPAEEFAGELRAKAASVLTLGGRVPTLDEAAGRLLRGLHAWETIARTEGLATVIDRWHQLARRTAFGASVEVETAHGLVSGLSAGLSPRGGLLVDSPAGRREVIAGELIRVRRRA